ncbi:YtxH domain-containing protein [Virgibacillus oceani]|uniref:General stress protein n=1 Tax=Virgibacillus oceani TaxID=1479511 RepID=A0A917HD17_9BACI|nr:YtxH domain-containing protein [Virgibacillus oceani]GGG74968.1 general stress protein [Virgibacillus oceani]
MTKGKSLLLGFVVGGVVSATATLLSTPASGKELRIRAKEQGVEWKHMLENLKRDGMRLKNQIAETSKEGAALIKDLTQEMKTSVQDWRNSVEPHQKNIEKYLEQIESSLKDLEEKVKKDSSI